MAGLLIHEQMLRGDLERCLIVAPGSPVEQWQTELSEKFGLRFDLLTNALVESTATGNAFVEHSRLIAQIGDCLGYNICRCRRQSHGSKH